MAAALTIHRSTPPDSKRSSESHRVGELEAYTDDEGQLELFWISSSPRRGNQRLHYIRLSGTDTETVKEALR